MASNIFRYILHADLDAFYASVEQRDNPKLKGKPVVVGGSSESRGVVAAASYESREFGIHSAMPMATALRLCPNLVRVPARFDRYREVSRAIMRLFKDTTPLVEPLSLDEAYLDISAAGYPKRAAIIAGSLKRKVKYQTDLDITIGGGVSKSVAKIASQLGKPDGLLLVPVGEESGFLSPLEVEMLWGVGPKTTQSFHEKGIWTIGDLADAEDEWLIKHYGKRAKELKDRALGIDLSPVSSDRDRKSVSSETTMITDIDNERDLFTIIDNLSHDVADALDSNQLRGKTLSLKLRLSDFTTFTRQTTLVTPTNQFQTIQNEAHKLLRKELLPGRKFRLVGVGIRNFQEEFQLPLLLEKINS